MKNTMLNLMLLIVGGCAMSSGCTSAMLHRVNRVGFATSSTLVLCDVASTVAMSDDGRWDRQMRDGVLHEQNPLLGSTPSMTLIAGAGIAALGVNSAIYASDLPPWVKAAWFGAVTVVESAAVAGNARFVGACGIGNQI